MSMIDTTPPTTAGKNSSDQEIALPAKVKLKRTTMNLPAPLLDRLEEIRCELGVTSVSEVLRNALKLYIHFYKAARAGCDIVTIDPDGNRTSYTLHLS